MARTSTALGYYISFDQGKSCNCCMKNVWPLQFLNFYLINNWINSLGHNLKEKISWGRRVPYNELLIKKMIMSG